jgi:hypothetical protein
MPGVQIIHGYSNADITLEEFSFEFERDGKRLRIFFSEQNSLRRMTGAKLRKALSEFVDKEATPASTN